MPNPNDRPSWHSTFMALAFTLARRSLDPSTKHGAVIVSAEKHILSMGYNSPPHSVDDNLVPDTRPDKYEWYLHSEENALLNCQAPTTGATVYVTGHPCARCVGRMKQARIARCVYGPQSSVCMSDEVGRKQLEIIRVINATNGVELVPYLSLEDGAGVYELLAGTQDTYYAAIARELEATGS